MSLVRLILLTAAIIRTCSIDGDLWEERRLRWLVGVASMRVTCRSDTVIQGTAIDWWSRHVLSLFVQFHLRVGHFVGSIGMLHDLYWVLRHLELQRILLILAGWFCLFLGDSLVWVLSHLVWCRGEGLLVCGLS